MATTLRDLQPATLSAPQRGGGPAAARRPFRDNPRLILLGIVILLAALVAMVTLADRAPDLNPNFLTEVLLYALSIADLTMLLALGFVLARNVVKLLVERRRGLPFSRFRAKLVGALLGLTIIPALLVLIVGAELIRSSTRKWVSQPVDAVLSSAQQIAQEVYRQREDAVVQHAAAVARSVKPEMLRARDVEGIGRLLQTGVTPAGVRRVDVYELSDGQPIRVAAADASGRSTSETHAASEALAAGVARGSASIAHQSLASGSELVQAGALVIDPVTRQPAGVVVASDQLSAKLTIESQRIIA